MSKKKKEVEDPNNTWNMQLAAALSRTPLPPLLTPPPGTAGTTPREAAAAAGVTAILPSSASLDSLLAVEASFTPSHYASHEWDTIRSTAKSYLLSVMQSVESLVNKGAEINHYSLMESSLLLPQSVLLGTGAAAPAPAATAAAAAAPAANVALLSPRGGGPLTATKLWMTPLQQFLFKSVTTIVSWLTHGSATLSNAATAIIFQTAVRDMALWLTVKYGAQLMTCPVYAESTTSAPPPSALSVAAFQSLSPAERQLRTAAESCFPCVGSLLTVCVLGDQPLLLERLSAIVTSVVPPHAVLSSPSLSTRILFPALWGTPESAVGTTLAEVQSNEGGLVSAFTVFEDRRDGFEAIDAMHRALVQFEYDAMVATLQSKRIPPAPAPPATLFADATAKAEVWKSTISVQFDIDAVLPTVQAAFAPLTAGHVAIVFLRSESTRCLLLHGARVPFALPVSAPGLTALARACAVNDAAAVHGLLNCGDLVVQRVTDGGGRHGNTLLQLALAPPPQLQPSHGTATGAAPGGTSNPPVPPPQQQAHHPEVLDALLERNPAAIAAPNADGDPPLVLLIKNRGILPSFSAKWSLPSASPSPATGSTGAAAAPATAGTSPANAAPAGGAPTVTTNIVTSSNLYELIDVLLSRGADPNQPDGLGMTPLMHAVTAFLPDVVKKLLSLPPLENTEGTAAAAGGAPAAAKAAATTTGTAAPLRQVDISARDSFGATALHYAAALAPLRGKGMTELLLQTEGVDVNAADGNGQTALHRAAIRGREQQTAALLAHTSCDVNAVDSHGNTALHRAVLHRKKDTVTVLLRRCQDDFFAVYGSNAGGAGAGGPGAAKGDNKAAKPGPKGAKGAAAAVADGTPSSKLDIDLVNHDQQTALQLAVTQVRDTELAELLLNQGASVNRSGDRGGTLLHSAVWGKSPAMAALLLHHGADVTLRDEDDETPLHVACRMGNVELAQLLLAHGADPHDVGARHVRTPLHYAAESYHADLVALLLQPPKEGSAASKHQHHHDGQTTSSSSASWVPDGRGRTALHLLCTDNSHGLAEAAERLEKLEGSTTSGSKSPVSSTPTSPKRGSAEDAITARVAAERLRAAELLLADGAPVDAADARGWLPLHCAASVPSLTPIVALLIARDASLCTFRDDRGWSPLHCAVAAGSVETVELLLRQMARTGLSQDEQLRRVDSLDRGPMLLAAEFGQVACAKLLIKASKGLIV